MTEKEAIEALLYQEDMRAEGLDYQVNNLVIAKAVKALEEIQQYRAIGTVEECREARERQMGKKPINIRLLETSGVHCGVCPICKNPVYADLKNQNHREYCGHCGQAIDWSDTD